ncbi:hypothetical protein BDZ91DRAFT_809422 [Kalaharituber pfeilii]|nr:hypothetical protein BDZ91DRAFT_809422 [Kalaharituber pfeilii]
MAGNIFQAAREGSLSERQILEYKKNNGNLDAKDDKGITLLCAAVAGGHHRVVRRLLRNGASVNEPSIYNCSALWFATRLLDKGKASNITRKLLEAGAEVDIISDRAMLATTPLMNLLRAGHGLTLISSLLVRGASVTFPNGTASAENDAKFIGNKHYIDTLKSYKPPPPKSYFISAIDYLLSFLAAFVSKFTKRALINEKEGVDSGVGQNANSEVNMRTYQGVTTQNCPQQSPTFDSAAFHQNLTQQIADAGLGKFFPPNSPLLETVMTKAAELVESGESVLASPEYLPGLSRLSLYQPILFCGKPALNNLNVTPATTMSLLNDADYLDNSGSMIKNDRIDSMIEIVGRITKICTLLLPDDEGVEIRFLNCGAKEEELYRQYGTVRTSNDAETMIREAEYSGFTMLGTILKRDVLQPFVYDVLEVSGHLKRPLLISIITDGKPLGEDNNQLAKVIAECKKILRDHEIDTEAVKFQISQIGDSRGAKNFLKHLARVPDIKNDIYITPGKIDEECKKRDENEEELEIWLLKTLTGPILAEQFN